MPQSPNPLPPIEYNRYTIGLLFAVSLFVDNPIYDLQSFGRFFCSPAVKPQAINIHQQNELFGFCSLQSKQIINP